MYDSPQFNGFVRKELDDLLFGDIWAQYVFNESDLHSAAYFYVRTYFSKRGSDGVFVRSEPQIRGKRPDLVVYDRGTPIYVAEMKMFAEPEIIDESKVVGDLEKLAELLDAIPTLKWGFFTFAYDADDGFGISDARLRCRGYENMSVSSVNLRRKEDTDRRRVGYEEWRAEFDRLRGQHARW